jgi:hypothetical protein
VFQAKTLAGAQLLTYGVVIDLFVKKAIQVAQVGGVFQAANRAAFLPAGLQKVFVGGGGIHALIIL